MSFWIVLRYKKILFATTVLFIVVLLILRDINSEHTINKIHAGSGEELDRGIPEYGFKGHRLAVLVPFRDRFDELLTFVPYISTFLIKQNIGPFSIHILNQSSRYRFNRGSLVNVGFAITKEKCDYVAVHDVDLLPVNLNLSYAFPEHGPYHVASPEYHPNYNYTKYFGGILLIRNEHFELVNGFSNSYFGWGLEDDEFYARIKAAKLPVFRPKNLTTNKNDTFLHFHHDRKRDTFKTNVQKETSRHRDRITGLNNLQYSITSRHNLTIDDKFSCTIHNVEIYCDINRTPWCLPSSLTESKQIHTIKRGEIRKSRFVASTPTTTVR